MAADESTVLYDGLVLMYAIVVAGDGAGAHVHAFANFRVSKIGQMVSL